MKRFFIVILMLGAMSGLYAQSNELRKQANNPLANMSSLNLHNYYQPRLTYSPSDAYMNTAQMRFAQPFADGKFMGYGRSINA